MERGKVLEVASLSKKLCKNTARSLRYGLTDILQEIWPGKTGQVELRRDEFWAVGDVSFTVKRGEAVAIVGRNGAGKTTLMRVLSGLLKPDRGEVVIDGRVNPVIELGQGLNSNLTGRENAELGLAWRNVPKAEIHGLIEEIEKFSQLGSMFDAPAHTYSSGMKVRLSFAIAAFIPCDILLLDEVLAVGDIAFQRKCIKHLQAHLAKGGSLILVSHNVFQMQTVCRRGILLDHGKLQFDGPIEDCIERLFDLQDEFTPQSELAGLTSSSARIEAITCRARSGHSSIQTGAPLEVEISYDLAEAFEMVIGISIWSHDLSVCITSCSHQTRELYEKGKGSHICTFPELALLEGRYAVRASLCDPETYHPFATKGYSDRPCELVVSGDKSRVSLLNKNSNQLVQLEHFWSSSKHANRSSEPNDRVSGAIEI